MVAATVHLDQFHPPAGEALESANLRRIDDVLHDTGDHSGRLARACSACRTSGPRGWRPAQGHRRPRSRGATTLSGKYTTPPRPRLPGNCSTTPVIAGVRGAICGHVMALDVHSSRPGRRSDDGQTILKAALKGRKLGFHLGKLVELRGFEPRTSCMPWGILTFSDATCWSRTARAARLRLERRSDHGQDDVRYIADFDDL